MQDSAGRQLAGGDRGGDLVNQHHHPDGDRQGSEDGVDDVVADAEAGSHGDGPTESAAHEPRQHPTAAALLLGIGGLRGVDGLRRLIILGRFGLGTRQVIHRQVVHGLEQCLHLQLLLLYLQCDGLQIEQVIPGVDLTRPGRRLQLLGSRLDGLPDLLGVALPLGVLAIDGLGGHRTVPFRGEPELIPARWRAIPSGWA